MNSIGNTGVAAAVALSRGTQKRPRKSPTIENVSQGRPRKRSRNNETWKRNTTKYCRNKGKGYISRFSNKTITAREIGPPCKCGCYQKIGLDNAKDIFNNFWEISDYNQQNYYISKLVHTSELKLIYSLNMITGYHSVQNIVGKF